MSPVVAFKPVSVAVDEIYDIETLCCVKGCGPATYSVIVGIPHPGSYFVEERTACGRHGLEAVMEAAAYIIQRREAGR